MWWSAKQKYNLFTPLCGYTSSDLACARPPSPQGEGFCRLRRTDRRGRRSLHNVGKLPDFCVIARSAATWQSPGRIHRNAQQKQTWYQEIPRGLPALVMTENLQFSVGAGQCPAHNYAHTLGPRLPQGEGFCRLRRADCPEASPYMVSETFQVSMSLRGAKRRGNLLVQSTEMHSRNRHGTGRFPRA